MSGTVSHMGSELVSFDSTVKKYIAFDTQITFFTVCFTPLIRFGQADKQSNSTVWLDVFVVQVKLPSPFKSYWFLNAFFRPIVQCLVCFIPFTALPQNYI